MIAQIITAKNEKKLTFIITFSVLSIRPVAAAKDINIFDINVVINSIVFICVYF